jgi:cell division protease FtsH
LNKNPNQNIIKGAIIVLMVLLIVNFAGVLNPKNSEEKYVEQDYTQFLQDVSKNKIDSVTIIEKSRGPRELQVKPKEGKEYSFNAPHDGNLVHYLTEGKVKVSAKDEPQPGWMTTFFFTWGPTVLFLVVFIWIMRKTTGGGSKGLFGFSKSKAQLIDPDKINVTFKDVVGCDESKQEVQEFVEFLKNPEKFSKLGGRTPRGVLLTGPAGTGKTLLAKALAKESGVPFFSMSGSDFIEMFVGVGASRVRDMFEQAKRVAPCVLFIDEIDTIGGKRGNGNFGGGGHDEREQTLNQILVELDGMDTNKGVILVGATNRPEVLDPALLRPGRIDRQIVVTLPDVNGREEILKVHSKNVPLANSCDLKKIGRGTPGFSGAELANLINESAIFAARRGSKFVEQIDLEQAKDKIMMGVARPSLAMSEEDKRETAYHESGHAVIAKLLKNADPVYKVTIIPRGRALGVTMQLPEKDRFSYKKEYLIDRIAILMGGRAAEEVFCNTLTTGASNDISVATSTARSMVMEWGMSSLGPIAYGDRQSSFLGNGGLNNSSISPETLKAVDHEVRYIIETQADRAKNLLIENRDKVEAMTQALMEVETLDDWQLDNIMAGLHYNHDAGLRNIGPLIQDEIVIVEGKDVLSKPEIPAFIPDVLPKA